MTIFPGGGLLGEGGLGGLIAGTNFIGWAFLSLHSQTLHFFWHQFPVSSQGLLSMNNWILSYSCFMVNMNGFGGKIDTLMRVAKAVSNLIEAFERLPGVGPKTAARLTYYLLHNPQTELEKFAGALVNLKKDTVECSHCQNIAETNPCDICRDPMRDKGTICVVEQPLDVLAVERSNGFKGVYHVLHGVINPLHNIGPEEIRIDQLMKRVVETGPKMRELILALNPNMEGEATCLYIAKQLRNTNSNLHITRLAHGLPVGADIEYADDQTLTHAMTGRREF